MNISIKETAQILDVTEQIIYKWIKKSIIPFHKINDRFYFNRTEIIEWATSRQMKLSPDIFKNSVNGLEKLPSLVDTIKTGGIHYNISGKDSVTVLQSIVDSLILPEEVDREFLFQVLLTREKMGSTGIGDGIAIPHVRNPVVLHVSEPSMNLCFLKNPIDFGAIDGKPVNIFFTLVSPSIKAHLHLLSRISFVLHDYKFKDALVNQASPKEILTLLSKSESVINSHNI